MAAPTYVHSKSSRRLRAGLRALAIYGALIVVCLLLLFPIYWMFTISLKIPREIYRLPSLWPENPTWANYRELIDEKGYFTNIRNSVIVARLRLGNSLHGLIVVYLTFAIPLSTWLLAGYFKGVPAELEEQAMVDGTTRLGALVRILLPLSLPGLVAVGIFTFTAAWNELLLALIFITSEDKRTVPLALQYLITGDVLLWGPIMAGAVLSALPVVILYFVAQRWMVHGVTTGSVKG